MTQSNTGGAPAPEAGSVQPIVSALYGNDYVGFAASRIGGRAENQDTCAYCDTRMGLRVLVFDGMGGGPGGKTASTLAARAITDYIKGITTSKDPEIALGESVAVAHRAITDFTAAHPQLRGMGSTVSALLISPECAYACHVGDSRIYQLRGHSVVYRSTDHSKVMEMVRAGVINEEQARTSGESNIITQALGHGQEHNPEIVRLPYLKGDRFALCSDGIWGVFPNKEIISLFTGPKNPAGAVDSTVIAVDDYGRSHGNRHDNLTLAILDTKITSKLKVPMTPFAKRLIAVLSFLLALAIALIAILFATRASAPTQEEIDKSIKTAVDSRTQVYRDSIADLKGQLEQTKAQGEADKAKAKAAADEAAAKAAEAKAAAEKAQAQNSDLQARIDQIEAKLKELGNVHTDPKKRAKLRREALAQVRDLAKKSNGEAKKSLDRAATHLEAAKILEGSNVQKLNAQVKAIRDELNKAKAAK